MPTPVDHLQYLRNPPNEGDVLYMIEPRNADLDPEHCWIYRVRFQHVDQYGVHVRIDEQHEGVQSSNLWTRYMNGNQPYTILSGSDWYLFSQPHLNPKPKTLSGFAKFTRAKAL